ncbi:MAG: hypothetical protein OXJ36_15635 [bacterium]|nr:hypothetical protein [bacterium]
MQGSATNVYAGHHFAQALATADSDRLYVELDDGNRLESVKFRLHGLEGVLARLELRVNVG